MARDCERTINGMQCVSKMAKNRKDETLND